MGCIIYSPQWLRTFLCSLVGRVDYILTLAWGFRRCIGVARFDRQGNAKAFTSWNEQQTGSTFSFLYIPQSILNNALKETEG